MSTYNKEVSLFVSSDPALGATNISVGGDFWTTQFKTPLIFPSREKSSNYTVSFHSGTIWWNARNITTANNDLEIVVGASGYTLSLEPGLYGITEISNAIDNSLVNNGHTGNEISMGGDRATQGRLEGDDQPLEESYHASLAIGRGPGLLLESDRRLRPSNSRWMHADGHTLHGGSPVCRD